MPGLIVATRLSVYDGAPGGWGEDLTEPVRFIGELRQLGVALVNVTLGNPYTSPHLLRPFEYPPPDAAESPEHPLCGVDRHFKLTAAVQSAFADLPVVGSGYSYLQEFLPHAAAANIRDRRCTFAGVGRLTLAQPDFARQIRDHGRLDRKRVCRTFSYCTALMRSKHNDLGQFAAGCPPFDKEVYGPVWRRGAAIGSAKTLEWTSPIRRPIPEVSAMPSPFPGMDPYLEDPDIFPDIHDSFIAYLREMLNARLPAPYYASSNSRVWIEPSHRRIGPDVNVLRPKRHEPESTPAVGGVTATAELLATEPVVVHIRARKSARPISKSLPVAVGTASSQPSRCSVRRTRHPARRVGASIVRSSEEYFGGGFIWSKSTCCGPAFIPRPCLAMRPSNAPVDSIITFVSAGSIDPRISSFTQSASLNVCRP